MLTVLTRQNRMGLSYELRGDIVGSETTVECITVGKALMMKHNISDLSQAWFEYNMQGKHIQDAFSFLDVDEREFLMTGILPAEFNEMIKEWGKG